ncbi:MULTISPECIES: hypothetical protein [Microvirgula]|uniref:hypothetical protein n=1 Tax=Microvirgula TaxID=57479 RepID=UPI00048C831A|nr:MULTISPECIES: hypothetical protein [Microvirgula]RAS14998.1 hypothetical protein DFO50_10866 [Microvirgula sp. AG722]
MTRNPISFLLLEDALEVISKQELSELFGEDFLLPEGFPVPAQGDLLYFYPDDQPVELIVVERRFALTSNGSKLILALGVPEDEAPQ